MFCTHQTMMNIKNIKYFREDSTSGGFNEQNIEKYMKGFSFPLSLYGILCTLQSRAPSPW